MKKEHGIENPAGNAEFELEMLASHDSLVCHREDALEAGLRKTLPPDLSIDFSGEIER
jgi:hypothetical protein